MSAQPRPFREDDEPRLRDLAAACRHDSSRHGVPQPHDLTWLLALPGAASIARVWDDAGDVVALALPNPAQGTLLLDVRPEHRGGGLEDAVLEDALAVLSRAGAAVVATPLESDDPWRRSLLVGWGFADSEEGVVHLEVRDLDAALASGAAMLASRPSVPLGSADEEYVEAHRAAYGTDTMDLTVRRAWREEEGYRPELDLVVRGDDGAVLGFSVGYLREDGAAVEIGTVGVVPAAQGQGIGYAAVLGALDAARRLGAGRAWTSTSTTNTAMVATARRAGLCEVRRTDWWQRDV